GDGCHAAQGTIKYSSSSKTLIRQVHLLLLSFGIVSKIVRCAYTRSYDAIVLPSYRPRFLAEVGFITSKKNAVRKERTVSYFLEPGIPYVKEVLHSLRDSISPS